MSTPPDQTLAEPEPAASEEEEEQSEQSEEWETMARAWVSSFPEAKAVSMEEVEAWIDSNFDFIPDGIKSMPRSEVCQRLIAIQNCMRSAAQGVQQSDTPASLKVHKDVEMKQEAPLPSTNLINVPQDSDLYMMKRKEALEKFQILVELEKLLAPTFLKRGDGIK
uniref:uncharacterized protein LOC105351200 isoform X2 n=1 Tax=Fragaria vesca subsp. vesca TaxID=101020 RepID=UPI0005CB74FF|nr:PREDICTED: uncharacterized protein LOC105351200 isoform X2 [Fragaria vesca subsp. vesca]